MSEIIPLPLKRSTILVVDDEQINIALIHDAVKSSCRVICAMDGEQALKLARKNPSPDLILLDVMMPEMNGYDVCRELKCDPLTKNIPVIFITSLDEEEDETKGFDAGAVDYIHKPVRPAIVRARTRLHLELKRQLDFHAQRSLIDGLTKVANRRRLMEHLDFELQQAKMNRTSLSVIMLDIDFFKLYNDNYGHIAGDECLKLVAGAIQKSLKRSNDLVARYGGEEFVCVLPETNLAGAERASRIIQEAIHQLDILHASSEIRNVITVSSGSVTTIPEHDTTAKDLLENADEALYYSKHSGRDRFTCKASQGGYQEEAQRISLESTYA